MLLPAAISDYLGGLASTVYAGDINAATTDELPTISISISGGGVRAALYGAGVLRALDGRESTSAPGTGGLLQAATYMSALSGYVPLSSSCAIFADNWTQWIVDALVVGPARLPQARRPRSRQQRRQNGGMGPRQGHIRPRDPQPAEGLCGGDLRRPHREALGGVPRHVCRLLQPCALVSLSPWNDERQLLHQGRTQPRRRPHLLVCHVPPCVPEPPCALPHHRWRCVFCQPIPWRRWIRSSHPHGLRGE